MIPRRARRFSAVIAAWGAKARQYSACRCGKKGGLRGLMAVFPCLGGIMITVNDTHLVNSDARRACPPRPSPLAPRPSVAGVAIGHLSSGIRHQASGTRHQASGIRHQASGTRYQISGTRYQAPDIRHQISSIRYQAAMVGRQLQAGSNGIKRLKACALSSFCAKCENRLRQRDGGGLIGEAHALVTPIVKCRVRLLWHYLF
ncbi:hypothetical protein SODG_003120 [Sodalis praecaptivus]